MANKKIFLALFATLFGLSVLAGHILPVASPLAPIELSRAELSDKAPAGDTSAVVVEPFAATNVSPAAPIAAQGVTENALPPAAAALSDAAAPGTVSTQFEGVADNPEALQATVEHDIAVSISEKATPPVQVGSYYLVSDWLEITASESSPTARLLPMLTGPAAHVLSEIFDLADLPTVPIKARSLRAAIPIFRTQSITEQTIAANQLSTLDRPLTPPIVIAAEPSATNLIATAHSAVQTAESIDRSLALPVMSAPFVSENITPAMTAIESRQTFPPIEIAAVQTAAKTMTLPVASAQFVAEHTMPAITAIESRPTLPTIEIPAVQSVAEVVILPAASAQFVAEISTPAIMTDIQSRPFTPVVEIPAAQHQNLPVPSFLTVMSEVSYAIVGSVTSIKFREKPVAVTPAVAATHSVIPMPSFFDAMSQASYAVAERLPIIKFRDKTATIEALAPSAVKNAENTAINDGAQPGRPAVVLAAVPASHTSMPVPSFLSAMSQVSYAVAESLPVIKFREKPIVNEAPAMAETSVLPERVAIVEPASHTALTAPSFLSAMSQVSYPVTGSAPAIQFRNKPVVVEPVAAAKPLTAAVEVRHPSSAVLTAHVVAPSAPAERASVINASVTTSPQPVASTKGSPVLITGKTAFTNSLLSPLNAGAPVSTELFPDLMASILKGPNAAFVTAEIIVPKPTSPMKSAAAQPVLITAKNGFSSDLLKPFSTRPVFAPNPLSEDEVPAAQRGGYCDPKFVGEPIRFSQTVELRLEDLINQLHSRFGVNFIIGPNIGQLPLNVKAGSIPWNTLLRSQLFISGVRARCIDANTIELVENKSLSNLEDTADVETRFLKLKFLQRTGSGTVDSANRTQGGGGGGQGGGCAGSASGGGGQSGTGGSSSGGQTGQTAGQQTNNKFDKLIVEIEKILGIRSFTESSVTSDSGGGSTAVQRTEIVRANRFVTQIPGRNILAIRATPEEHELINQIVIRADRPPFQVVIKGLVYTANQDRLRDIGVQTTITGAAGDGDPSGGIFGHTLGLGGTLFDFSTMIGTFDFNVQATALQQNGVISVKSRPFATVLDGLCTTLDVGRELPIVIDSTLGGQGDVVFVNASNSLAVTPYVIDDENGNPMAVTLELLLSANDIDSTITARGIPAVSKRSIQTQLLLGEDNTVILGGFTVDSDSKSISKTPGLGDIPIIGNLFKRRIRDTRINRLYFAISVSVIPFGEAIEPVRVPGATTDPPGITPEMQKRSDSVDSKTPPNKPGQ